MSVLTFADIEAQYAEDAHLNPEDVARVEAWQRQQPHLPPPTHPITTAQFLQYCGYNNELTKQRIDTFYTFRTHCPEFFANRDPLGPEVQLALDTCILAVLPELTPEGCTVNYVRLQDPNLDAFNYNAHVKICDMLMSLIHKQRGFSKGHIFVVDVEGCTLRHLLKCPILSIKKSLIYLQAAIPTIIKSFHFVNGVPFMDKIVAVMRPFLGKELRELLYVHYGDNSTIFKFVPRENLPIECGGLRFYAADYYRNVIRKEIENHAEFFKQEEQLLVDESKRPGQPTNLDDLFGVEGTFKKLDFD